MLWRLPAAAVVAMTALCACTCVGLAAAAVTAEAFNQHVKWTAARTTTSGVISITSSPAMAQAVACVGFRHASFAEAAAEFLQSNG